MNSFTADLAAERMRRRQERIRRLRAERDEREAELVRRIPRLAELQAELAQIGLAMARAVLRGPGSGVGGADPADLARRGQALTAERDALLRAHGADPHDLEVWWDCPDCQDTGWIRPQVAPGQESVAPPQKCHCLIREEIEDLYRLSGLTPAMREHVFERFDLTVYPPEDRDYMAWVREECRRAAGAIAAGEAAPNLLLEGGVGLGKTFLAAAMANAVLARGRLAVYFTFPEFLDVLRRARFDEEALAALVGRALEADLLVLDDLGAEKLSEFVAQELFNILNRRVAAGRPLVIATNLDLRELRQYYGERIESRIVGHFEAIRLRGQDVRLVLKQRQLRAVREGRPGRGREGA
ncbi:ATP-binding protein [Caldinitratiruptor microaerophilus]|uniref:DNA replication protein DnaC n=1 Tax=Caldinitratiruptor microaerophilus TaxID=671077 RepID=A0AA35CMC3_9FIRM|nr:ATP-binding protein [Caldinitratiruptor microaerophilus]BDG61980.1 DNA replication protein DnaC [Caldinitratiruptor microaerophilus]